MKYILGIDTSQQKGMAFLGMDGAVAAGEQWDNDRFTGTKALHAIESIMGKAGVSFDSIGRVAVVPGPGGFGVVRTGVVTAMMVSEAASCDLVTVRSGNAEGMLADALSANCQAVVTPVYL